MAHPPLLVTAFAALLAASALGQGAVLVVDAAAGPFTAIQPAIDAAADGDVVLVKAGTYPGFAVFAKGVTITADLGHVVNVNGTISIAYVAATQLVVVRGVRITVPFVPGTFTPSPMLVNDAGAVWFEDCIIIDSNLGPTFSGFQGHGVAIDTCASVVFTRCSITGSTGSIAGEGLHCVSSTVSLHDCTVRGPDVVASVQPIAGGHAPHVERRLAVRVRDDVHRREGEHRHCAQHPRSPADLPQRRRGRPRHRPLRRQPVGSAARVHDHARRRRPRSDAVRVHRRRAGTADRRERRLRERADRRREALRRDQSGPRRPAGGAHVPGTGGGGGVGRLLDRAERTSSFRRFPGLS